MTEVVTCAFCRNDIPQGESAYCDACFVTQREEADIHVQEEAEEAVAGITRRFDDLERLINDLEYVHRRSPAVVAVLKEVRRVVDAR